MNPNDNSPQSRANTVWTRFVGMFGGDAVDRKYGLTPPPEWVAMISRLNPFEVDRGLRRLAYSGKAHVPSLPEFTSLCRAVGDDTIEEGPRPLPTLPKPVKDPFDGWDIAGNTRFWKYITRRLTDQPRAWGAPGSTRQAEATRIAVGYKNAWAQDMRDGCTVDPGSGEIAQPSEAEQTSTWINCMGRAEADIMLLQRGKAA